MRNFFILFIVAILFLFSSMNLKAQPGVYCTQNLSGGFNFCANYSISAVSLNTIYNTIHDQCGVSAISYGYYYDTTSLIAGHTYILGVNPGSLGPNGISLSAALISVWFDWNHDGVLEPSEWTEVSTNALANTLTTVPIAVPINALPGTTRMRIRTQVVAPGQTINSGNACSQMGTGNTEDYDITVLSPNTPNLYLSSVPGGCAFNYVSYGSSSLPQTLLLSGTNLTGANVNISVIAPTGFQVSLLPNSGYSSSLYFPYSGTSFSSIPIYVKFVPNAFNTPYNDGLLISGGGASVTVGLSGTSQLKYCSSFASDPQSYGDIFNVTLGALNITSDCNTLAPDSGSVQNSYSNYTMSIPPTNLIVGQSYPLSISVGNCASVNNNFSGGWGVWIDYNQNGIWDSIQYNGVWYNEMVYKSSAFISSVLHTEAATVAIPPNAVVGPTRLRIVYMINTTSTNVNSVSPCNNYLWGETEDYTVNIIPAVPCITPVSQPTAFVFNPSYLYINGAFTASAGADHYLIIRSLNPTLSTTPLNGTYYNTGDAFGGGTVVAYQTGTSFTANNLNYASQYYYYVFASNSSNCTNGPFYLIVNPLTQSANTLTPTIIHSIASGLWSDPSTWSTGTIPDSLSTVYIDSLYTVHLDTSIDICLDLIINKGGVLDATGTNGILNLQNNLTNNGILNLFIDTANYASLKFLGTQNATYSGIGINNIYQIALNKTFNGTINVLKPTLELTLSNLTVKNTSTDTTGFIPSKFNGIYKFSGSFTLTNRLFTTSADTIPTTGGIWLNNPNFTISGQASDMQMSGLLHISQGTYNIGKAINNTMFLNFGSYFIMDGGVINSTGRMYNNSTGSFNMSGGIMTVSTIGNTTASGGFDYLGGNTLSPVLFSVTGGTIVIQNANSSGANKIDVRFPIPTNTANVNILGSTIKLGNAFSSSTAQSFAIDGQFWDVIVDTTTAQHGVSMNAVTAIMHNFTNTGTGTFIIGKGTTGQTLKLYGNFITKGNVNGNVSNIASLEFVGTTSQIFNIGSSSVFANLTVNNPLGVSVNNQQMQLVNTLTLIRGAISGTTLTLGNGTLGTAFTLVKGAGSITNTPVFNFANMNVNYTYNDTIAQITGSEIPFSISGTFTLNNLKGLTLNSKLTVGALTLQNGILTTYATKVLTITGTSYSSVNGGSFTSFVNGPLARAIPANAISIGTWTFPIGTIGADISYNPFAIINPTTGANIPYIKAFVSKGTYTGTPGQYMLSVNTDRRWNVTVDSGNFTFARVQLTDTGANNKLISKSATINGTFAGMQCMQSGYNVTSIDSTITLANYFALGTKNPMLYLSSTVTQSNVSMITPGAIKQQVLGIQVVTVGNASPLILSQINFNTNGTTSIANDITNVKLYSTTNSTFATNTVIDSTINFSNGTFVLNPSTLAPYYLIEGVNYFWLTYDINANAPNNDVIDAQCLSVTVDGIPWTPTITNPYGNRKIFSTTTIVIYSENFDEPNFTIPVTIGWTCPQTGNWQWQMNTYTTGWTNGNGAYTPTGALGTNQSARYHSTSAANTALGEFISPIIDCSSNPLLKKQLEFYLIKNSQYAGGMNVYISYDKGNTWSSSLFNLGQDVAVPAWTKYTIYLDTTSSSQVKIKFTPVYYALYGDIGLDQISLYTVTDPIQNYLSSGATQPTTSPVLPGNVNQQVLTLKVVTQYTINPLVATSFVLNTIGSTNALADIDSAKIYYTKNSSTFATTNLFGSVANPNGSFVITGTQSLSADTNYFWLVYNFKLTATAFDTIDAQFNSVTLSGIDQSSMFVAPDGCRIVRNPLNGVYTINNALITTAGTNYNSFTDAISDLNFVGFSGAVTFNVINTGTAYAMIAPTGGAGLTIKTHATATSPIVFQNSGTGAKPILSFLGSSGTEYGIYFNGASYITLDGLLIQDAGASISNYVENGIGIIGVGNIGNSNITIKNCVVKMSRVNTLSNCIYQYYGTPTSSAGTNSYIHYYNDSLLNSNSGIYTYGHTNYKDLNTEVGNCVFNNLGGYNISCYVLYGQSQDSMQVFNNIISNISTTGASGSIYNIYLANGSNPNIYNNKITNILSETYVYNLASTGLGLVNIYNNELSNMSSGGSIYGMQITNSGYLAYYNVYGNKIYNISCTGTASIVYPIYLNTFASAGTPNKYTNIYNNMIYGIGNPGATSSQYAVYISNASANSPIRFYNNTILINYTSTNASNVFYGMYIPNSAANPNTVDIRNNIIVIKPNMNTGTRSACIFSSTVSPYYCFQSTCDNNLLYAGVPNKKNLIFYDGTNLDSTLVTFKTRMTPREQSDVTDTVPFINIYTQPYDVHIKTNVITQAESHGQSITFPFAIATDIDGDIRQGETGYTGTGAHSDIGADEFNGVTTDASPPVIYYTTLPNATTLTGVSLNNVTITDPLTGVNVTTAKPRLYYKKASNANTYIDNTSATNGWKYSEATTTSSPFNFTLDYSKLYNGVNYGDTMLYFVVAQDNVTPIPNVGGDNTVFTVIPTSINLTPANFPITAYKTFGVAYPVNGTYYVGTGQTFTSLTSAIGGFFNFVNNNVVTGNVIVKIKSDLTETGNLQLNTLLTEGVGNYSITIKPDTAIMRTISGPYLGGLLRIQSANVLFDGSNNGTGIYLKLKNNTGTATTHYVLQYLSGANNCSVKNCFINGTSYQYNQGIVSLNGGTNNLTITNDSITNCKYAINISGNSDATTDTTVSITNNQIGSFDIGTQRVHDFGIYVAYANGVNIDNNLIQNMVTSFSSITPKAIYLGTSVINANIRRNTINKIANGYAGATYRGASGIEISTSNIASNINIVNNKISNIGGIGTTAMSTYAVTGIRLLGTTGGVNIYNNSINMFGNANQYYTSGTGQQNSTTVYIASTVTNVDIRNNILYNSTISSSTASRAFSIYSDAPNTAFNNIDYNDYYVSGSQGVLGYLGTNALDLNTWKTNTSKDAHSLFADPLFTSSTNLLPTRCPTSPVVAAGTPLAAVPTDILNNVRSLTPTIGAYEMDYAKKLSVSAILQEYYLNYSSPMNQTLDMDMNTGDMFTKFANPVVDTLSIQIRSTLAPDFTVEYEFNGYNINTNGTITPFISLPTTISGYHYLVINHRNSIETWSDSVNFSCLDINYNFYSHSVSTQFPTNMFADNAGGTYHGSLIWGGDVGDLYYPGRDGVINIFDLNAIFDAINDPTGTYSAGYILQDLNGDGVVNIYDLGIVFDNLNFGASSINPFTMKKK